MSAGSFSYIWLYMYTGNIHTCSSRSQAIIYWLLVDNNQRGEGTKACVCVAPFGV